MTWCGLTGVNHGLLSQAARRKQDLKTSQLVHEILKGERRKKKAKGMRVAVKMGVSVAISNHISATVIATFISLPGCAGAAAGRGLQELR